MNARFLALAPTLFLAAAVASAATTASLGAALDGFETEGVFALEAAYNLPPSGATARLTVEIEDCGTFTYTSTADGSVTRSAPNTYWSVGLDLEGCRDEGTVIARTHHCDGYGNAFETCEVLEEGGGEDRAIVMTLTLTNRGGASLCNTDLDGDGDKECDIVAGTLLAHESSVVEDYVPARYWWEETDGTWTCESREEGDGARDPDDQGGSSCEDLGL
jgi:hypothetical protein